MARKRSEVIDELNRLISRPKLTFDKGLMRTENDNVNGYASELVNMEIDKGYVKKRKGTAVINNFDKPDKWIFLEEVEISGTKMLIGIDQRRFVWAVIDSYPLVNFRVCRESVTLPYRDRGSYHLQFAGGDNFFLINNAEHVFIISNTGEAYRIQKNGVLRIGTYRVKYFFDDDQLINNIRDSRDKSENDLAIYIDIVNATNRELKKFYTLDVKDKPVGDKMVPIRGMISVAPVNEAGVISKFSAPINTTNYEKFMFGSIPMYKLQGNKLVNDDGSDSTKKYIKRTTTENDYEMVDSIPSQTISSARVNIFVVRDSIESRALAQAPFLGETPTFVLEPGVYIVPITTGVASSFFDPSTINEFLQLRNIRTPESGLPISAQVRYDQSIGDLACYITDTDVKSLGAFAPDTSGANTDATRPEITVANDVIKYRAINFTHTGRTSGLIYKIEGGGPNFNQLFRKTTGVRIYENYNNPFVGDEFTYAFNGQVYEAEVDCILTPLNTEHFCQLPETGIEVEKNVWASGDFLVRLYHKGADHWSFSLTDWIQEVGDNVINPDTLDFGFDPNVLGYLIDGVDTRNAYLSNDRIAVLNEDNLLSISQKGIAEFIEEAPVFQYSRTAASGTLSNYALKDKPFLLKISSPVSLPIYRFRSFPFSDSGIREVISGARFIEFNANTLFVVQGNSLWLGNDDLMLRNLVDINSTIEHMVAIYNGVLVFTAQGILRVTNEGKIFKTKNYRAKSVTSSGDAVYFVTREDEVIRGVLRFSDSQIPFIEYEDISFAINDSEWGFDPIIKVYDNKLFLSDRSDVYVFEDNVWKKHLNVGKNIDRISYYNGRLILTILDDLDDEARQSIFEPITDGGDD